MTSLNWTDHIVRRIVPGEPEDADADSVAALDAKIEALVKLREEKVREVAQRAKAEALYEFAVENPGFILESHTMERYDTDDISPMMIYGLEKLLTELKADLLVRVIIQVIGPATDVTQPVSPHRPLGAAESGEIEQVFVSDAVPGEADIY